MNRRAFFATHDFELVAVRHGQTAWNATGRFQGHTDVALDERGRAQARAVGAALSNERFDLAIASDLARARETAELVTGGRIAIETDARWREMRFGVWEGLTWPEIVARSPALGDATATSPKSYTPEGGESFDALCERIERALEALDARAFHGARILVASHAGPLHGLLRVALGESAASALGVRFSPASVTRIAFGPGGAALVSLNVTQPDEVAS